MSKAINEDVCIIGSDLVIGIYFPPVDGIYTLKSLRDMGDTHLKVWYYIINTDTRYPVALNQLLPVLESDDPNYDNTLAFIVDTTNLHDGVLMVDVQAEIPDSRFGNNGTRTEIARCSTGIAIIK